MDEKKKVFNTQQEANRNPLEFLAESILFGTGNAIERQEAQGQKSFVESDTLPMEGPFYDKKYDTQKILESFGFKLLGPVPGDPLFQFVELPPGWKKVATNHSMHSDIVDEQGRKRIGVFYKAAFYDRKADYHINCRYSTELDYDKLKEDIIIIIAHVKDAEKIIFSTEPIYSKDDGTRAYFDLHDKASEAAEKWLTEHYPNWENPGAYWNGEPQNTSSHNRP